MAREHGKIGEQMRHHMRTERKANRREKGNKLLYRCSNELTGMMPTYFMSMSDRNIPSVEHKKNVTGLLDEINIFLQGETDISEFQKHLTYNQFEFVDLDGVVHQVEDLTWI